MQWEKHLTALATLATFAVAATVSVPAAAADYKVAPSVTAPLEKSPKVALLIGKLVLLLQLRRAYGPPRPHAEGGTEGIDEDKAPYDQLGFVELPRRGAVPVAP